MFEQLETRQMFSATVAVDPASTTDATPQPTVEASGSINLFVKCATGEHFAKAVVDVRKEPTPK